MIFLNQFLFNNGGLAEQPRMSKLNAATYAFFFQRVHTHISCSFSTSDKIKPFTSASSAYMHNIFVGLLNDNFPTVKPMHRNRSNFCILYFIVELS